MAPYDLLKPVESSMFSRAGYSESAWELLVEYRSTSELRGYSGVSPEIAEEVLTAKSIGSAFNTLIKGKFEHIIYGADPAKAAPAPLPPEGEGYLSKDDIESVLGSDAKAAAPITGTLESMKAEPPAAPPDLDPATAIALPQQKGPEIESMVEHAAKLASDAGSLVVRDAASYEAAGQMLKIMLAARDRAFNFLDPIRNAIFKAYQLTQKKQREALDPIDTAISELKRRMFVWTSEQERMRLERQAEANRKAEEEARRIQQEQSQQLTLAEVNDALEEGNEELAESLLATPIEAPLPYVPPTHVDSTVPDVSGIATRKNWKVDATNYDLEKFLMAVKEGRIAINRAAKLIQPYFPALNRLAKSLESAFDVDGFIARNEGQISARRK